MKRISIIAAGALAVAVVAAGAWHARDANANDIANFQTVFSTDTASAPGLAACAGSGPAR